VSIGLVIYGSVLPVDLAWRSLLLATVYQKMIVPHYFSGAFFVVVRRNGLKQRYNPLVITARCNQTGRANQQRVRACLP
jgi:hypothetical protein